ncbi:MAG: ketopantoate reductase family protein [Prolixibacteraceae bacterium]
MTVTKINSVYILGLGAMGAMYASKLLGMQQAKVKIIADTERIKRYRTEGVTINGEMVSFDYITPDDDVPPADLIIVAVKSPALEEAIRNLGRFVGKDTIIISLLNGISSEEIIGARVGMEHLLYAYGVAMVAVREGTSVRYSSMGEIVFGEKENVTLSSRVLAVKDLFNRARIPYRIPENMIRAMWSKFMINVGSNQASAILKAPHGVFQKKGEARELMILAAREVVLLSQKCGINLNEDHLTEFLSIMDGLDPNGKTSMLQDIEAGRKTEVDIFAGTVTRLGKQFSVETPVNDVFYRIIRSMEAMQQ